MARRGEIGNLLVQMRADMGQLKLDVKQMESTFKGGFDNVQRSAANFGRSLANNLGVALSVGALISFSKQVTAMAGHLTDLADQTGISAQLLSGMKSTLEEAGTSVDSFARGVFRAQQNIGQITSESDMAARAAKSLGLNLVALRNSSPEKFIEQIAEALSKVENVTQRNSLGAQLLGRQYQELGPALALVTGKFEEFRAKGISEENLRALDKFGDSMTRISNSLQIMAAVPLANIARLFDIISGNASAADKEFMRLGARLEQINAQIANIDRDLAKQAQSPAGLREGAEAGAAQFFERRRAVMMAQRQELAKQALEIEKQIAELRPPAPAAGPPPEFKPLVDETAQKSVENFFDALKKQEQALKGNLIELRLGKEAALEYGLTLQFLKTGLVDEESVQRFLDLRREIVALTIEIDALKGSGDTMNDFLDQEFGQTLRDITQKARDQAAEVKRLKEAWDDMRNAQRVAMEDQDLAEFARGPQDIWEAAKKRGEEAAATWERVADSIGSGVQTMVTGVLQGTQKTGDLIKNFFRNIMLSISNELLKISVFEPLKQKFRELLQGVFDPQQGGEAGLDLSSLMDNLKGHFSDFTGWLGRLFSGTIKGISSGFGGMINSLGSMFSSLLQSLSSGASSLGGIFSGLFGGGGGGLFSGFGSIFSGLFSGGGGGGGGFLSGLGSLFSIFGHSGGLVTTNGIRFHSGGEVPAMLQAGEFVIRRPAAGAIGAADLGEINRTGQLPERTANITIVNDYSGALDPRGLKTTQRETVQHLKVALEGDMQLRNSIKGAAR